MPKESRSRMQKWPSSTLCPPNSTVTGTTHFYPVAIRSAHVICAQALTHGSYEELSNANETIPPAIDDLIANCIDAKARRIESVKLFSSQLSGALQIPARPLSELLTHGKLQIGRASC